MRTLPEVVLKLPSLAVLQASGNRVTHLPDALDQLKSLQALMVSENQVLLSNSQSEHQAHWFILVAPESVRSLMNCDADNSLCNNKQYGCTE